MIACSLSPPYQNARMSNILDFSLSVFNSFNVCNCATEIHPTDPLFPSMHIHLRACGINLSSLKPELIRVSNSLLFGFKPPL
jgi:hypothetical protein